VPITREQIAKNKMPTIRFESQLSKPDQFKRQIRANEDETTAIHIFSLLSDKLVY